MAENKTRPTGASTVEFMKSIDDLQKKKDCETIASIMRKATGKRAKMWGDSIVGFGEYHYRYNSGREGDFLLTGFSPRKQNIAIYIMNGFKDYAHLMNKLGKHRHSVSCLYIKRLSDVDTGILEKLIRLSVKDMTKIYKVKN